MMHEFPHGVSLLCYDSTRQASYLATLLSLLTFFAAAYKSADGKKIDGRRVLVDVERGRTVKGWRPRRLGGGLGSTRRSATDDSVRPSGRQELG